MRKGFKYYVIIWAILLALFNVVCFVSPTEVAGMTKFSGAFWTGYAFITLSFIGQLICAGFSFKETDNKKFFLNIPLISISYTTLIITLIFGAICMAVPDLPNWVGIILCFVILAFGAISVIKAKAAAEAVSSVEEKVKSKTAFIKLLATNAQNLLNRANAPMLKEKCKKVYEALRYSDPVSSEQLNELETQIKVEFDLLTDAVLSDDLDKTESSVKELLNLISERNNKAKLLK